MSLVDPDDVPPMLRAGAEDEDVEYALSVASAAVEAYCERKFDLRSNDVVTITSRPNGSAQLPDAPVTAVTLVEAWLPRNGAMAWVPITNYAFTEDGLIYDTSGLPGVPYEGVPSWPALPKSLRVTYTHGYADIPAAVALAVIKAAGDFLANPERLARFRVDDVERQWFDDKGSTIVDGALLSDYRLKSVP